MRIIFISLLLFTCLAVNAQNSVDELINDGVALHDKQDYEGALAKYNQALQAEPSNTTAMFEKSYTLMAMKRYKEAEELLVKVLKDAKEDKIRRLAYVQYGTVFDYQGEAKKSIKVYEKGLKEFPNYYLLAFNKGVTEMGMGDREAALESFKRSVIANPLHGSSHIAIAELSNASRIPSILADFTFLLVEPQGKRAEATVVLLNKLWTRGVERKDDKNVTVTIDASLLDPKNKPKEDDFSSAEMLLSIIGANNQIPDSIGAKNEADRLSFKMQMLINMISENKDNKESKDKGFFKNFYVPMLAEMKEKGLVPTACYIALASTKDQDIQNWLDANNDKVEEFYTWFKSYSWTK